MTKGQINFDELRRRAVDLLQEREVDTSYYSSDLFELIEELKIYQTELEVQNEELKSAQQEISSLQRRYQDLYEFAPCGYITLSHKGIITLCNLAGASILGAERGSLKSMALSSFLTPDSSQDYFRVLQLAEEKGESQTAELELLRRDGEWVWVMADIQPQQGSRDSEEKWRVVLMDISERKRMERALQRKQQEQALLLDSIPVQVWYLMDADTYGAVNQAHAHFLGYPRERLEYSRLEWFLSQEEAAVFREGNLRVFSRKETVRTEEWLRNARGEPRLVASTRTPRLSVNQEVEYVVCSGQDITEQKEAERNLRFLSFQDGLTGLYNRYFFEEEMSRLERSRHYPLGIIVCDINGLKLINDTLGHYKGDEVLKATAEILGKCFRSEDIIARIGGDEFAVLLPGSGEDDVLACCERVEQQLGQFYELSSGLGLSLAIGHAVVKDAGEDIQELFKLADAAMYKDKRQQSYSSRG